MLPTWCSTVLRLMNSRCEISGLDSPSPSSSRTSSSRLVSRPTRGPRRRDLLLRARAAARWRRRRTARPRASRRRAAPRGPRRPRAPGLLSREALARSSRHSDASNGSWAWVNPSNASRSQASRVAQSRRALRQRHQRARVRRGVRLGARLELPRSSARGPRRRPAGRRPARRAAGCTSCWPGRAFCSARCAQVERERALAASQVQRGPDPARVRIVETLEQARRLVVPALLDPQVGEPDQGAGLERPPAERPQPDGLGQRRVRLGPAAGRGEDAAVVGAAVGAHGREVAAFGDLLADADPLLRPAHVAGVLAGGEQLAEDLLQDDEVLDVAAGDGGQRLVEHRHALLDAVAVHQAGAEVGRVANVRSASPVSRPIRSPSGRPRPWSGVGGEHPLGQARPSRARCSRGGRPAGSWRGRSSRWPPPSRPAVEPYR